MKEVKIIEVKENKNPVFVKTKAIVFEREGVQSLWEMIKSHDSVHVLVNNIDRNELILVKQVRIPVLANGDATGICLEACAGIVDKDIPLKEIAREEILEEIGYDVPVNLIQEVSSYKSSLGTQGGNCSTYYVEVEDSMKVSEGGGLESEDIEVVYIKYTEVRDIIRNGGNIDATTLFLLTHFLLISEDV